MSSAAPLRFGNILTGPTGTHSFIGRYRSKRIRVLKIALNSHGKAEIWSNGF
jgi:hypothetical protein